MEGPPKISQNKAIPKYSQKFKTILQQPHIEISHNSVDLLQNSKQIKNNVVELLSQRSTHVIQQKNKQFYFYRVKSIGVGAHSFVYMVQQDRTNTIFAEKSIVKQHAKVQQSNIFWQIKIQSMLNHDNIIKLYHFYLSETHLNLVLQYAQQSLFSLKQKYKYFKQKQVIQITRQIIYALKYLHDLNIVHADIKLQNIMISSGMVKICDFGLAYRYDSNHINNKVVHPVGTLEYLSQEYASGLNSGFARDIWAVGIMALQMITGAHPFSNLSQPQKWKALIENDPSWFLEWLKERQKQLQVEWPKISQLLNKIFIKYSQRSNASQLLELQIYKQ